MPAKENPKTSKSKSKTKTSIADLYTDESKTTLTNSDEAKANVLGNFSSVFTVEPEDSLPELHVKDIPVINYALLINKAKEVCTLQVFRLAV